ncbi:putative sucrose utilization protein [Lachnellula hyalina]|uniref:Putative sucrose utilization protein n=1 Tax=Lachnellula hyalina TaxID=1316788 RepID=A0A8H8U0C3_9HELO|nr:putative sucrose utilization protein [Lachnellula hyalina]TVY27190.1 putative sucrose utilization protein [Lachnellula hyalina]
MATGNGRGSPLVRVEATAVVLHTHLPYFYGVSLGDGDVGRYISRTKLASPLPSASDHSANGSLSPTPGKPQWHPIMSDVAHLSDEPISYLSDQYRPNSPNYLHLIPVCLELFTKHIYPIMPLIHMPTLRASINRPLEMFEKNLVYSLCALTSTHMSGKSISAPGPPSWEATGRFFLDECISVRQSYDFVEDKTLGAVISSYFLSTASFELNQSRKSWYYLREALTMGQDLGLHDEKLYVGLPDAEALCRRRTFWILYVTERSFAILRHKPLTLTKTPGFPSTLHEYEAPEIHSGFMHLVHSYHLLDSSFVDSWNESSDAPASTLTYTALQQKLNLPHPSDVSLTDIQKADILVTQQWLRLVVWQSSMRQGLLSWHAEHESMTFCYPLKIAYSLLSIISSLPTTSIEVHGMGIFEKIFEIGNTMLDITQTCGSTIPSGSYGVVQDPLEMFVKTLSQTPNSQRQYANILLAKAAEKPQIQRFSQMSHPVLTDQPMISITTPYAVNPQTELSRDGLLVPPVSPRPWRGSIVGEIGDDGVYKAVETVEDDGNQWGNFVWVPDILIHEMHRAVFVLYECVRQQEYRKECKTLWGHDVYWQAAAQAIEKSVVLGWHPKLYRCASLVGDLCSRGSNLPNVAVLRSLDLDVAEIKSEQTRVRRTEAFERIEYQGTYNIINPETYEDIKKWFDFFNDVYFAGLLTGLCRIAFVKEKDEDTKLPWFRRRVGLCTHVYPREKWDLEFRDQTPFCQIDLTICHTIHPLERIRLYLQTLLHEMLHAMFRLYQCRCDSGCKRNHEAQRALGSRGHHESWHRAAMCIEKSSYLVLGWRGMDLNRHGAMAAEIYNGRLFPSDEVLSSLQLDKTKVQRQYEQQGKKAAQASSADKSDDKSVKWLKSNRSILKYGIK